MEGYWDERRQIERGREDEAWASLADARAAERAAVRRWNIGITAAFAIAAVVSVAIWRLEGFVVVFTAWVVFNVVVGTIAGIRRGGSSDGHGAGTLDAGG